VNRTKLICNLSGNVECDVDVKFPDSLISDKSIDMLAIGFEKSQENNELGNIDLNKIEFNLYASNVNDKKLKKLETSLKLSLGSEKKIQNGI